jgi:acyl-CoA thioesterase-1
MRLPFLFAVSFLAAVRLSGADARPVIVAFGDSLTAGKPGESFPEYLQKSLDSRGYRYRVINEGVPGDTTTDGLARVANVLAHKPGLVILEFGGNDGLRGLPVDATRANLEKTIAALRKPGVTIVLAGMTLPPNYGPDYIKPFERIYPDLARKYGLRLIPFLLADVALVPGLMSADGIHPNAKGAERVALTVLRAIEPLLKK